MLYIQSAVYFYLCPCFSYLSYPLSSGSKKNGVLLSVRLQGMCANAGLR